MKEENKDFELEKDLEEDDELDDFIVAVGEKLNEEDSKTAMTNPFEVQKLFYVCKLMSTMLEGTNAEVSQTMHKPYKNVGYVTVKSNEISFDNPKMFLDAMKYADNFEVYPNIHGKFEMHFGFNGLTVKVE